MASDRAQPRANPSTGRQAREAPPVFEQPQDDELVERDEQGEYLVAEPRINYKFAAPAYSQPGVDNDLARMEAVIERGRQMSGFYKVPAGECTPFKGETVDQWLVEKMVNTLDDDKWIFEGEAKVGQK